MNNHEDMIDHRSYIHSFWKQLWKKKPEKNSGLNGIPTHDLYNTGALLLLPTDLRVSSQLGVQGAKKEKLKILQYM